MFKNLYLIVFSVFFGFVCLLVPVCAFAQQESVADLDGRLRVVEDYLDKLPPSMATYVGSLEESINQYTKNLESGLTAYSERLEQNLEARLMGVSNKTVVLDPYIRGYKKIDTPTGIFFLSVDGLTEISGGYRMSLQIGNPNYADFKNFTLRVVWGTKWTPNSPLTYEQWRATLNGAQYTFSGRLNRGKWNPVEIDIVPAESGDLAFVECELGIGSIELDTK